MKGTPERELELIYAALGDRLDKTIWPAKLSAPAAVQRLVNSRNEELLNSLTHAETERDASEERAQKAEEMAQEYAGALGRAQDRCARLEHELALARSESLLAVADRLRDAALVVRKRLRAFRGRD